MNKGLVRQASIGSHSLPTYVSEWIVSRHLDDIRDRNAITRLAAGYLKLLFPDLKPSPAEFLEYCLRPAVALRQTVRDQLAMMDPEYKPFSIEVAVPTD